ncbi:hypothetical protein [Lysobacter gummosus]
MRTPSSHSPTQRPTSPRTSFQNGNCAMPPPPSTLVSDSGPKL